MRAFAQAGTRLQQCMASSESSSAAESFQNQYSEWQQLRPRITASGLRRGSDLMDTAMNLVFQIERDADSNCGAASVADKALLLIARQRGGSQ